MADYEIRPFRYDDADYQARVDIIHSMDPDYHGTAADARNSDESYPKEYARHFWMVEADGAVIGMITIMQNYFAYHPEKWSVRLAVRPSAATPALFEQVMAFAMDWLADKTVIAIQTTSREDGGPWLQFLLDAGFAITMREHISQLAVQEFDVAPYAEYEAAVRAGGIEITDAEAFSQRRDDWLTAMWQLETAINADVPSTDETQEVPFADYRTRVEGNASLDRTHWIVALDGDEPVGMTLSVPSARDATFFVTYSTGVLRSHRRRGIALALKVEGIRRIQAAGGTIIDTSNEEKNPMYQINQRLGFKALPSWLDLEKSLT